MEALQTCGLSEPEEVRMKSSAVWGTGAQKGERLDQGLLKLPELQDLGAYASNPHTHTAPVHSLAHYRGFINVS